jgi:hypothetical protein
MTALTKDRSTPYRDGVLVGYPVKAAAKIWGGSLVAIDSTGNALKASSSTGLACVGIAERMADNTAGANGAETIIVRRGLAKLANSGSAAVTRAHIGAACYAEDDQTVTSSATGKSVAGIVVDVESDGVWLDIGRQAYPQANDVLIAEFTITSAQMLALFATPRSVLPAPGAGLIAAPVLLDLFYDYGTAAYAGIAAGEDLALKYTDAAGTALITVEATGFLDQTSDQRRVALPLANFTPVANAPLVLHMLAGEIITGDSPLKGRLHYRLLDASW